jgi:alpha-tubulin suppressor-like RCC1 family protein
MGYLWGLLSACGAACGEEFPNEPTGTLTIQMQADSKDTLTVRDIANLVIQIGDSRGETITGIEVDWESSDPAVLELKPVPALSDTPDGSLITGLTIQAIAHARGKAFVVATIDRPGFQRTELTDTITILERWLSISAGAAHTCAIASDSSAYCWGAGQTGALGGGRPLDSPIPARVLGLGNLKFLTISAGQDNTCGIIAEGVPYCWGLGTLGRLGDGDLSERNQFTPTPVAGGPAVELVSAGKATCATAKSSPALCWGGNSDLQLGVDSSNPFLPALDLCTPSQDIRCSVTPRAVNSTSTTPTSYSWIDVGGEHTCGISAPAPGRAFCWGRAALGHSSITESQTPVAVFGDHDFESISAGGHHTCGVSDFQVYCWGVGSSGQLGDGTATPSMTPVAVTGNHRFRLVSGGDRYTCGLTDDSPSLAYCWGLGSSGQLGNGSVGTATSPVAVSGGLRFSSLSSGDFHACGVADNGAAYCWGNNARGQLGDPAAGDQSLAPVRVREPNPD